MVLQSDHRWTYFVVMIESTQGDGRQMAGDYIVGNGWQLRWLWYKPKMTEIQRIQFLSHGLLIWRWQVWDVNPNKTWYNCASGTNPYWIRNDSDNCKTWLDTSFTHVDGQQNLSASGINPWEWQEMVAHPPGPLLSSGQLVALVP